MAYLLLLLSLTAQAGEIRVQSYEGVRVQLNGRSLSFDERNAAWAQNLRAGSYTLRVIGPRGRVLAQQRVSLRADERQRFAYIDQVLVPTRSEWVRYAPPRVQQVHRHDGHCGHLNGARHSVGAVWGRGFEVDAEWRSGGDYDDERRSSHWSVE